VPLPDLPSPENLSLAELRDLAGALIAEVRRLQAENRALKDEVARLKGLPPRPPARAEPSGMERATGPAGQRGRRRRRGAKRDRDAATAEVVVKAAPPPGSRFKGYQDILVRELTLMPEVVRYRRERWLARRPARRCWRRCRRGSSAASDRGCAASCWRRTPRAR
jgi:hypothetical protein